MLFPLAFNLGPWEIGLIALLALLLFGGKKLPSLAKDLGSGIKEFRKSLFSSGEEPQVQLPEKEAEKTAKPIKQKKS